VKRILITGASRGLGDAFAHGLGNTGDELHLVSRREPPSLNAQDGIKRHWINADLSSADAPNTIAATLSNSSLDALVLNAGIWESTAFSSAYNFERIPDAETREILNVNLLSPIALTRALLPMLRLSNNPKIILIGSINGLENSNFPEVAYNASKWGLRGVAHALREHLRPERIGVTIINPGSIAPSDEPRDDMIPPGDLVRLVRTILELSRATVVKEIDLPAMSDVQV
jgi:NAD(P)-dependent dehydrogenase (short-subunit alcohol dehydrogenase family)